MRILFLIAGVLLTIICVGVGTSKAQTDNTMPTKDSLSVHDIVEKTEQLLDPAEYVIGKLKSYDLVMIGEHHYTKEQPAFIEKLIKHCYEKNVINFLFLEFGEFEDQWKIDTFLQAKEYDPSLVIEMLKNSTTMGWGHQEYFDIFKTIYFENKDRPENEKIRIVLVDGPPSTMRRNSLYDCFGNSSLTKVDKWRKANLIWESIAGRDPFMAAVIAAHLFDGSGRKGIYYAGSAHIRKDLREKSNGMRLFSAGGILSRKYPSRVFTLTFHKESKDWQNSSNFQLLEKLYTKCGKAFAVDSSNERVNHLKLKSEVFAQGAPLGKVFDGYIVLNLYKDYQISSFIDGFYDDEFAKTVWERFRQEGTLKRLPPELEDYKTKPWSGKELIDLMKQGVH